MAGTSTNQQRLEQRYGAPRRARGPLVAGLALVLLLPLAGMVAWAGWSQATPEVRSELIGFTVEDDHLVVADVQVQVADRAEGVQCVLRALAADKAAVGEGAFTPERSGRQSVEVRTSRLATSVLKVGCTAEGQKRPR